MSGRLFALGAAGAVGAYLLWKMSPTFRQAAEPVLRDVVKANVKAIQKAKETYAHLSEIAEDAYAEAWSELNEEAEAEDTPAEPVAS